MSRRIFTALAPVVVISALALTGCSGPSVPMQPAEDAGAPECAEVTVRLPDTVDDLELRYTNAQATGAWGNPASVLLRCGVATPPPTTDQCLSLDGIDWVEDDSEAPTYRYTTYGRTPAVEVVIDSSTGVSGLNTLMDLNEAVSYLPQSGACVGAEDVLGIPTETP
ncbi:DUF3515 domain-containing protein [Gulosibacter molinativorax]|uniref:DUF3515 domain-containing protein n=1 Tax=Gulosibacter molinativorax TaxID=256821 RepID=A0ABT7C8I1_9MICO|nr:DUF3515 domain-containing protein [Gulosibacter molinativorax]MDJ1371513.1 DUF3515 domain-containing protein [Gulosibacter molinativorax]QUY62455.1 Secreted protein [Gulosibacter molinativorax]